MMTQKSENFNLTEPLQGERLVPSSSVATALQNTQNVPAISPQKKRLDWMDAAKGVGIFAIVLHHLFYATPTLIAGMFDVPVFFFISGYFLSAKKEGLTGFLSKKAQQLIKPYIIICLAIIIGAFVIALFDQQGLRVALSEAGYWAVASLFGSGEEFALFSLSAPAIGAIWFLLALFWGTALTKYILIGNPYAAWVVVILVFAGYATAQYVFLPWSVQPALTATTFIYAGYLAKSNNLFDQKLSLSCILACCIVVGMAFFLKVRISMVACVLNPLAILAAFAALILILVFCKELLVRVKPVFYFFKFAGTGSLVILGAHLFDMNLLSWSFVYPLIENTYLEGIAIFVLKVCLYLAVLVIVNLIKKTLSTRKAQARVI